MESMLQFRSDRMLKQIIYLAVALYFKKRNPKLGLKILLERWSFNQLPDEFLVWWEANQQTISDQCGYYITNNIHFTYPGCLDYPQAFLSNLDSTPLLITYFGHPQWNQTPNLAVVGSRKMSVLTKEWINEELLAFLSKHSMSVVSGGARGVDQAAHLCALRAKRPTYVFLPSGLDKIYPRDLQEWKHDIVAGGGAFLSEYWPDEEIKKHYFIERNRLIAAMANFVLVVQGEQRSGTMLTAKWAIDLGRDIGVLPGHPRDPGFSGNLSLMRSGVPPVMDHQDLEGLVCWGK